jgi:hypothetical protein
LNLIAPAPYANFATRCGSFVADGNGIITDVPAGSVEMNDLITAGCQHQAPAAVPPAAAAAI